MEQKLSRSQLLRLKAKQSALKFRRELRKSITTAIVAAFGFLIALSWRDVITSLMEKISETSPVKSNVASAIIVTIFAVIGILIISKFNDEKEK